MSGPFAIWMAAPELGLLAQQLGGHVRFRDVACAAALEFRHPVHGAHLARAVRVAGARADGREGRGQAGGNQGDTVRPPAENGAPADELAIYDFVKQLYRDRRVNDRPYKRVHKVLGDAGMVELVGTLGYYAIISMMLNVFRAATAPDKPLPFREPAAG